MQLKEPLVPKGELKSDQPRILQIDTWKILPSAGMRGLQLKTFKGCWMGDFDSPKRLLLMPVAS